MTERTAGTAARSEDPAKSRLLPSVTELAQILLTFCIVCLGWVLFRADSLTDTVIIWQKIVTSIISTSQWQPLQIEYSSGGPLFYTLNTLLVFVVVEWIHRRRPFPLEIGHWPTPVRWPAYTLVLWLIVEHADRTPQNPFIYFQF